MNKVEERIKYIKENWVNVRGESSQIWPRRIEKKRKKDGWLKLEGNKIYVPYGETDGVIYEVPEGKAFEAVLNIARLEAIKDGIEYVFKLDDKVVQIFGEALREQMHKDVEESKKRWGGNGLMFGEAEVLEALDVLF